MTVRYDFFKGDRAEDMYETTGYKQLMYNAGGYSLQDITDTCLDLLSIFQYAAYMGDYDPDFSGCEVDWDAMPFPTTECWREMICNCVADCYVFGIEPHDHNGLLCELEPDQIHEVIDLYDFQQCAVDGGLLEMLEIWLMGTPAEFIVPEEWQMKPRKALGL